MENNSFEYTYSARRQQEVDRIRRVYLPREEDKLTQLRRLHAIPTRRAQTASLTVGILGMLLLGTGMSLCMTELASALGSLAMILGIVVGVAGIAAAALAWPVFRRVLKKEREKITAQILQLSEELL
jgi:uncharacterized membrane protein YccF (DUF307 family)